MARISDNLERSLEMDIKQFVVVALAYLAGPIGQLGQPEKVAMLLAASESLMIEFGLPHQPSDLVEIRQFEAEI